jgi:sulfate/thiosulfate transport system ATP-binding protein
LPGVTVITADENVVARTQWLIDRGASEVLLLPQHQLKPQRVLIHWTDDSVRRATLAVAASVLRHVPAEAIYLGILPSSTPEDQRPAGMRELLDARSEALAMHGLDIRTELRYGDVADELLRQLTTVTNPDDESATLPQQMLILGISDPVQLTREFGHLLQAAQQSSMLIVFRPDAMRTSKVA